MPSTLSIESLSLAAVDVDSVFFNFGAGFGETWESVYPTLLECPYCQDTFDDDEHTEGDACPDGACAEAHGAELERPECSPMMNYTWGLPYHEGDPERDQTILYQSSVNMVLVKIMGGEDAEDTYALALSGGGMNFAWDIARAYILLGYAPPITLYDSLPMFAGQDNTQEPFAGVLKACFHGLESARNRLIRVEKKLLDIQAWTGQ